MDREWNLIAFQGGDAFAAKKASVLAVLADAQWVNAMVEYRVIGDTQGGELYIEAERRLFNPQGQEIEDTRNGKGQWETVAYRFVFSSEGESTEFVLEHAEPLGAVEEMASQIQAVALAEAADADFIATLIELRVVLSRFGGQARIIAGRQGDQTLGYVIAYEHRKQDMVDLQKKELSFEVPEENLRDEIEAEIDKMENESEEDEAAVPVEAG